MASSKRWRWTAALVLTLATGAVVWFSFAAQCRLSASVRSTTRNLPRIQRAQPLSEIKSSDQQEPRFSLSDSLGKAIRFQGKRYRQVGTLQLVVTAYCPEACCCGDDADGVTASGRSVQANRMRLVAADTKLLPFGTLVSVAGYHDGMPVPVWDRGGKIKGYRLDVLMPTHAQAKAWGRQLIDVPVWRPASD